LAEWDSHIVQNKYMKSFEKQFNPNAPESPKERPPVEESETTISYLGVTLEKATAQKSGFVPERDKLESFFVNDEFALELQKKIATAMKLGQNLLVEGGTAIGKTTTVAKMCAELGYELHYVNLNGQTDVENLMGRYIPNIRRKQETDPEYEFADGSVTSGLRKEDGKIKVIVLDEVNATHPGTLKRLNEVLNAVEQGGTVVLTEDAAEQIKVSKKTTKVIALMNPSGQGYLGVNPLSKELINRFVYQKEANELPRKSFGFRLKSKTGRGPKTETVSPEHFIYDPQERITIEQYGEIPGVDEIEAKYEEFHFAAKELLKQRKLAEDQTQLFLFDDQRESDRVIDYVRQFYTGDINDTFQQALRYYYANKLESEADRKKLGELIRLVEYKPKVAESKRKGTEREEKTTEKSNPEAKRTEAIPETKLEGPVVEQIEVAIEKLGRENVFGPKEVEKTFSVRLREVPEIPFSVEELERAEKMGQMLVLRVDRTDDGKPMSLSAMNDILAKRWEKEKKGGLLNTADGWRDAVTGEKDFVEAAPRSGWALVSKDLLPDSVSKNYIDQTDVIIKALREKAFKDIEMPEEYEKAIQEFESNKNRLTRLMSENWEQAAKELSELRINQLTRQSIQETIYDLAMYYDTRGKRLLPDRYTWSNSRSRYGNLVHLGNFDAKGVIVGWRPGGRGGGVGVSLSRRL